MCEGDYGRIVRNAMVEALWQDCDTRAKSVGDMAASVRYMGNMALWQDFVTPGPSLWETWLL